MHAAKGVLLQAASSSSFIRPSCACAIPSAASIRAVHGMPGKVNKKYNVLNMLTVARISLHCVSCSWPTPHLCP